MFGKRLTCVQILRDCRPNHQLLAQTRAAPGKLARGALGRSSSSKREGSATHQRAAMYYEAPFRSHTRDWLTIQISVNLLRIEPNFNCLCDPVQTCSLK
jgi:hypothetical protein